MHPLLFLPISFAVAVVGTIVGAGGGFLLVPILLFAAPELTPEMVTFVGLVVALFNSISATISYARMKRIDVRTALIFGLLTICPAVLGVFAIRRMDRGAFLPVFGILLIAVAGLLVRRLIAQPHDAPQTPPLVKPGWTRRTFTDAFGTRHDYAFNLPLGATLSGAVGFLSSFFGIGGGIVHVPIMTQLLRFPVHIATATSMMMLLISTLTGVTTHLMLGREGISLFAAAAAGTGAVLGGQVGARIAKRLRGRTILLILAGAMVATGIKLIATAF